MTRIRIIIKGEGGYKIVDAFQNHDGSFENMDAICKEAFENENIGDIVGDIVRNFDFFPVSNISMRYEIDIINKILKQYAVKVNWDTGIGIVRRGKLLEEKRY